MRVVVQGRDVAGLDLMVGLAVILAVIPASFVHCLPTLLEVPVVVVASCTVELAFVFAFVVGDINTATFLGVLLLCLSQAIPSSLL